MSPLSWGDVADIIVPVILLIAYIVRNEMALKELNRNFNSCREEKRGTLAEIHAKRENLQTTLNHNLELVQTKLDNLLLESGILKGKVSMIEKKLNGEQK